MSSRKGYFKASRVWWLISILIYLYSLAFADYHYASHSGSNTYPYTSWETAADSIQKAINAATAGDTVYVGSGVWEDAPYELWRGVSLIGIGIDSTVLRKPGRIRIVWANGNNLIQGFTLDGIDRASSLLGIDRHLHDTNFIIRDNKFVNIHCGIQFAENAGTIQNNMFLNLEEGINANFDACTLIVKNNTFIDNTTYCLNAYRGIWKITNNVFAYNPEAVVNVGIYLGNNDSGFVANNIFFKNQENLSAIFVYTLSCNTIPSTKIENNTFIGPDTVWYHVAITSGGPPPARVISTNNAIMNYKTAYYAFAGDSINITYNNIWATPIYTRGDGNAILGEGNLFQDPMFVNVDSGDVRLQAYSPLIDTGDPNILDYDGTRSDIGVFGGPGGRFYEYQDLPPQTPDSLSYTMVSDSIILNWRINIEADFNRYIVWRDTVADFTPWAGNIISEPDTSYFIDFNWDIYHNYYYKIAAYDNQWNLSGISHELEVPVTSASESENTILPRMTEINTNYPNPFNSQTTVDYTLSDLGYQPAEVKLFIYNISGQLVRKLVDSRQYPGNYNIVWDGLGEGGAELSSGIYFARLIVSGIELQRARKITLLK